MALQTTPRKTAIVDAMVASEPVLTFQPKMWLVAQMSPVQKRAGSRDTMAMPRTAVLERTGERSGANDAAAELERTLAKCSGKMFIQSIPSL